jgi:hypothetical protein
MGAPGNCIDLIPSVRNEATGGGAEAIVGISKLRDYCLDPQNPRGRYKARVFLATLGLAQVDAGFLRAALLQTAREADVTEGASDEYGDRYSLDFEISRGDRRARLRSAWIVLRARPHRGSPVVLYYLD